MSASLGPGSRLGPYEVVAPLESGGMASLFLARRVEGPDTGHIALKVVRPHLARDAGYVQMFVDEARLGARLVHPNIVRIEELGQAGGTPFLAMEYVNGISLAQLITWLIQTRRGLSFGLSVHIGIGIARALHVAHELRDEAGNLLEVVHRDVSPQNILLGHDGGVKLIDFGVAKSKGRNWATVEGSLKGKLGYMSPEQALGRPIDRRTDVYALGVVLWEALTQRRLFVGDTQLLLAQVQHPNILSPRSLVPSIPAALDDVVMRALHPDPLQRFATAAQLAAALEDSVPQAPEEEREAIAALVLSAADEVRASEAVSAQVRDALRLAPPTQDRQKTVLHGHTREIPLAEVALRPSLAPVEAPVTRVSARAQGLAPPVLLSRTESPSRMVALAVGGGLSALLVLGLSGLGVWWLLSTTLESAPSPAVVASPPPAPATVSAPMLPGTSSEAIPTMVAGSAVPETIPTTGSTVPEPEAPAEATVGDEAEHSRGGRHRSHREAPATLPAPWSDDTNIGRVERPSRVPPAAPANRAEPGRGPVRLPPMPGDRPQ